MARPKLFNNPFGSLRLEPVKPAARGERDEPRENDACAEAPANVAVDEAELFRAFVGEVEPVRKGAPLSPPPPPSAEAARRIVDDEAEAFAELCELVAGIAPFDLDDSDEHIEGAIASLDKRVLRRLRAGDYAVQAHLDLHGRTRAEAKIDLERFVDDSRRKSLRCILVIHGRGLHSKDQLPVLKEGIQRWLTSGRIGAQVLAFCTARPHDGGFGAVYVLLRR